MSDIEDNLRLKVDEIDPVVDPKSFGFATTDELEPLQEVVGQERALEALDFGLSIRHSGYNVFVSGLSGTDKKQLVHRLLAARAALEKTPADCICVHNFDKPDRPLAFKLPAGKGAALRDGLAEIVERLGHDLREMLRAKDFGAERRRLTVEYGSAGEAIFGELVERARRADLEVRRQADGEIAFVPLIDGKPMEPEAFEKLPSEQRDRWQRSFLEMQEAAAELMLRRQDLVRKLRGEVEGIVRAFADRLLQPMFDRLSRAIDDTEISLWLDRARRHMLEGLGRFATGETDEPEVPEPMRAFVERRDPFLEYRVNVLVDRGGATGAPVVVENSPDLRNLFGTVEREVNLFGRSVADFTRIRPGSLLSADGGYLILELEDAITEPLVWKQLKRTLKAGALQADVYDPFPLFSGSSLKPMPIPLDVKVVAVGTEDLYYTLQFADEDFRELFRVRADFGPEVARTARSERDYARFVARRCRTEKLPPFDAGAVAEVVRFGMRTAADRGKLSVELAEVADLVRESGHWARVGSDAIVSAAHVRRAQTEHRRRNDRLAERVRELIHEGTLRIQLEGSLVGQANGLSVLDLGDVLFGRPTRVSASVGVGQEGVVNIERESKLSGGIHDKGMLILEGWLRTRYADESPLALTASIAFEQSYGTVDGDSAGCVELFCLLSALAEIPLRQDIAVTGSIDQYGNVQAIGGANEKVEGFFDVCAEHGLTGTQGVCLPRANVRNLVLRPDVIDAIAAGRFHVYAIEHVDQGIELMTGVPAGHPDLEDTVHYQVDQRFMAMLAALSEKPVAMVQPRLILPGQDSPQQGPPPFPGDEG